MAQKILYLVSEDWYFVSHRLPMARAAKAAGYDVHVATRVADNARRIADEGFSLHPIEWRRGSMNPFRLLATILQTRRLYRTLRPDLVHHVALVPMAIGSIAAIGLPITRVNALTGLGYVFTSNALKARIVRSIANPILGWLLRRPAPTVLVQNPDDRFVALQFGVS
ncbi:MAG: glycosyltransferase, partial [Candidatus Binataceae bacterium]